MSPGSVLLESNAPTGSSNAPSARHCIFEILLGLRLWLTARTFPDGEIKATSIGNRIPNVCNHSHGTRYNPSPGSRLARLKSPRRRSALEPAHKTFCATIIPFEILTACANSPGPTFIGGPQFRFGFSLCEPTCIAWRHHNEIDVSGRAQVKYPLSILLARSSVTLLLFAFWLFVLLVFFRLPLFVRLLLLTLVLILFSAFVTHRETPFDM